MRALKGIVFIMTLAIAVLMTMLIYGMYQKSQNPDFKFFNLSEKSKPADTLDGIKAPSAMTEAPASALPTAPPSGPTRAFGDLTLPLPVGASVQSATVSGDRMVLIVTTANRTGHEVWVVSLTTGQVLGRVKADGTN